MVQLPFTTPKTLVCTCTKWERTSQAELTEESFLLFRAELCQKYSWREPRPCFEMQDFRGKSEEFTKEYPVVLSTTYSIKGTLNINHVYDYLIVDEASQVDLATGVLALASARNVVIVGDIQQLPNVVDNKDLQDSEEIWSRYSCRKDCRGFPGSRSPADTAHPPPSPSAPARRTRGCHCSPG